MTNYTPTTEQVRSAFANRAYTDTGVDEFLVQFDRWLEAHDREVAARALRDAAAGLRAGARGSKCNPGYHEADQIALRLRADRLEEQGVEREWAVRTVPNNGASDITIAYSRENAEEFARVWRRYDPEYYRAEVVSRIPASEWEVSND